MDSDAAAACGPRPEGGAVMSLSRIELDRLKEMASQKVEAMAFERRRELAAELSLLERLMDGLKLSTLEIAEAKYRHAASDEAGAWSFAFVQRLVNLGLPDLGAVAMARVPAKVLLPILGKPVPAEADHVAT